MNDPTPPALTAAGVTGQWTGPIAYVNKPSSDGRYLKLDDPAELMSREMPLPLLFQADLAPGHEGGKQGLGLIDKVWVEDGKLMAHGMFDMQDPEAASIARKIADGYLGSTSVDLEPSFSVEMDHYDAKDGRLLSDLSDAEREELDINPVNYEYPDEVARDDRQAEQDNTIPNPQDKRYDTPVAVFSGWTLMSATLVSQPAFADARICMDVAGAPGTEGAPGPVPVEQPGGQAATDDAEALAAKAKAKKDDEDAKAKAPLISDADVDSARTAAVGLAMDAFRENGVFALPVADADTAWDAGAATARIAKWASSDGSGDKDKIAWPKYGKAFLYKDPETHQQIGAYKFPYADVVDGGLKVVPKAVFAAAGRLDSADIPDTAKDAVKSKLRGLYSAIGKAQGRKLTPPFAVVQDDADAKLAAVRAVLAALDDLESPQAMEVILDAGRRVNNRDASTIMSGDQSLRKELADSTPRLPDGTPVTPGVLAQTPVDPKTEGYDEDERGQKMPLDPITKTPKVTGRNVVTASAAPVEPPSAWFADPALPLPTPITVTRDGRILGHLATWDTCHTGFPDACVTAPRSTTGYALFHVGSVITADGEELAVGKITIGTDHASTRSSVSSQQAMAHYADTGCGVAVVRAGEDEFGIWVAGSLVPEATKEQVAALRSSPLSGDWRRYGANLELIAALAVNTPGFPIPRPTARTNEHAQVAALTAAGCLAPHAATAATPCDGGRVEIDIDALTAAVIERVDARQQERALRAERAQRAASMVASGKAEAARSRAAAARRKALAPKQQMTRVKAGA